MFGMKSDPDIFLIVPVIFINRIKPKKNVCLQMCYDVASVIFKYITLCKSLKATNTLIFEI